MFLFLTFFSYLIFFIYSFYKKNSKVELYSSKTFFWWPSSNFAIVSCKMSVTFELDQDILCLET